MKKNKSDKTLVCENCCQSKDEKECYWVHRPTYRYILCSKCLDLKKPLQYDLVVEKKEKVHLQCPNCKSKKTIIIKELYDEKDFFCKKCKDNTLKFI